MKSKKPINWAKYPVRRCMYCKICECNIIAGQLYYDGGYGRRAHFDCVGEDDDEE